MTVRVSGLTSRSLATQNQGYHHLQQQQQQQQPSAHPFPLVPDYQRDYDHPSQYPEYGNYSFSGAISGDGWHDEGCAPSQPAPRHAPQQQRRPAEQWSPAFLDLGPSPARPSLTPASSASAGTTSSVTGGYEWRKRCALAGDAYPFGGSQRNVAGVGGGSATVDPSSRRPARQTQHQPSRYPLSSSSLSIHLDMELLRGYSLNGDSISSNRDSSPTSANADAAGTGTPRPIAVDGLAGDLTEHVSLCDEAIQLVGSAFGDRSAWASAPSSVQPDAAGAAYGKGYSRSKSLQRRHQQHLRVQLAQLERLGFVPRADSARSGPDAHDTTSMLTTTGNNAPAEDNGTFATGSGSGDVDNITARAARRILAMFEAGHDLARNSNTTHGPSFITPMMAEAYIERAMRVYSSAFAVMAKVADSSSGSGSGSIGSRDSTDLKGSVLCGGQRGFATWAIIPAVTTNNPRTTTTTSSSSSAASTARVLASNAGVWPDGADRRPQHDQHTRKSAAASAAPLPSADVSSPSVAANDHQHPWNRRLQRRYYSSSTISYMCGLQLHAMPEHVEAAVQPAPAPKTPPLPADYPWRSRDGDVWWYRTEGEAAAPTTASSEPATAPAGTDGNSETAGWAAGGVSNRDMLHRHSDLARSARTQSAAAFMNSRTAGGIGSGISSGCVVSSGTAASMTSAAIARLYYDGLVDSFRRRQAVEQEGKPPKQPPSSPPASSASPNRPSSSSPVPYYQYLKADDQGSNVDNNSAIVLDGVRAASWALAPSTSAASSRRLQQRRQMLQRLRALSASRPHVSPQPASAPSDRRLVIDDLAALFLGEHQSPNASVPSATSNEHGVYARDSRRLATAAASTSTGTATTPAELAQPASDWALADAFDHVQPYSEDAVTTVRHIGRDGALGTDAESYVIDVLPAPATGRMPSTSPTGTAPAADMGQNTGLDQLPDTSDSSDSDDARFYSKLAAQLPVQKAPAAPQASAYDQLMAERGHDRQATAALPSPSKPLSSTPSASRGRCGTWEFSGCQAQPTGLSWLEGRVAAAQQGQQLTVAATQPLSASAMGASRFMYPLAGDAHNHHQQPQSRPRPRLPDTSRSIEGREIDMTGCTRYYEPEVAADEFTSAAAVVGRGSAAVVGGEVVGWTSISDRRADPFDIAAEAAAATAAADTVPAAATMTHRGSWFKRFFSGRTCNGGTARSYSSSSITATASITATTSAADNAPSNTISISSIDTSTAPFERIDPTLVLARDEAAAGDRSASINGGDFGHEGYYPAASASTATSSASSVADILLRREKTAGMMMMATPSQDTPSPPPTSGGAPGSTVPAPPRFGACSLTGLPSVASYSGHDDDGDGSGCLAASIFRPATACNSTDTDAWARLRVQKAVDISTHRRKAWHSAAVRLKEDSDKCVLVGQAAEDAKAHERLLYDDWRRAVRLERFVRERLAPLIATNSGVDDDEELIKTGRNSTPEPIKGHNSASSSSSGAVRSPLPTNAFGVTRVPRYTQSGK